MKVLVVEDEEIIRKGIVLAVDWESIGCTVVGEASNGIEGLGMVQSCCPDLIITDLKMPKMDGIEMVRQLRESGHDAAVIVLTAFDYFEYARSALRLGVVDFLLKPFHDGELEAAVVSLKKKLNSVRSQKDDAFSWLGSGEYSRYVQAALEYIRDNYSSPEISVASAAEAVGISEGHLSRMFKRETGTTILSAITGCRIRAAMELLHDYRARVYEVADKVGYKDIAYFSSTFKKIAGVSPSEYQDSCR